MDRRSKFLSDAEYRFIYSRVPRLLVDIVVRNRKGVLLSRRAIPPEKGSWHLPGGRVRYGETLERAARRIAGDEIGYRVEVERYLGAIEYLRGQRLGGHGVSFVFLVEPAGGSLRGSWQGRELKFWNVAPQPIVREQRAFLVSAKLIKP